MTPHTPARAAAAKAAARPKPKPPPRDLVFAELRRLRHDRVGQRTTSRHETYVHVYAAEHLGVPRLPVEIVLQHLGDGDLRCVDSEGSFVQAKPLVATTFRFTGEVQDRPITFSERSGSLRVAIYEEEERR